MTNKQNTTVNNKPVEGMEELLDSIKEILVDHENRAYKDFNPDYFVPGEMRDVGVVVDRAMEQFIPLIRQEMDIAREEMRQDCLNIAERAESSVRDCEDDRMGIKRLVLTAIRSIVDPITKLKK